MPVTGSGGEPAGRQPSGCPCHLRVTTSVHMASLLHLAVAQTRPRKGDYAANLAGLGEWFAIVDGLTPRPQVLQFPETALTGYFVEGGVRDLAVTAGTLARDLDEVYRQAVSGPHTLDVVVGFYESWRDTLYNSALYVRLGDGAPRILHVHRKNFLPTYGLFDEERFVERGHAVRAFDTPWGRAALLVCEDAWHSISGTLAALDDAQLIFLSAAAPARGTWPHADGVPGPASVGRWERLVRDIAEEHGVFVALSNLTGSEGGKMFQGGSMVAGPRGDLRVRGPLWKEALLTVDIDLDDLARVRADMPLLADLRTAIPHLRDNLAAIVGATGEAAPAQFDPARGDGTRGLIRVEPGEASGGAVVGRRVGADRGKAGGGGRGAPPNNDVTAGAPAGHHPKSAAGIQIVRAELIEHGAPPPLEIDAPLVEAWLVAFIQDEMRRRNFSRAVVGLSGGVDSAVTTFLAARALGAENVTAVRMPYRTSSPDSLAHAQLVIDQLGVQTRTIDIAGAVDGYLAQEPDADPGRRGNVMARTRMIALFDLAARYHALPLGTGNKTERLFGYFTWHADDSPPINPLGDLYKTQVWALAKHLGVPDVIVAKPASADLISGQTDEGDFGISYSRADQLLNWLLYGFTAADLCARGFDAAEIELVRRRLEGTHWKRRLPTVAMLSPTAIGESYLRPVDY
jgi:NAD+ synthase (glutamine-hydrolysing)